jgi:hypothetical protein
VAQRRVAAPVAKGGALLAGSLAVANALGYALNLAASRRLGPQEFGAFASLMGVVLLSSVGALALQSVTARRVATDGEPAVSPLMRLGARSSLAIGGLLAAGSPLLAAFLHVQVGQVLMVAAAMVPLTLVGSHLGVAQGGERFTTLAVLYVAVTGCKMGGALVGLIVRPDVTAGMVGLLIGSVASAAAAALVTGRHRALGDPSHAAAGAVVELVTAGAALFAFFGLTNVDLLLARHHLTAGEAGIYALGAVVAKGTFWFPQFVSVLAYPMLVDDARRARAMRISVAVVAGAGLLCTIGAALAPGIVVSALGGSAYEGLERHVWVFAAVGSLFALAQLLLYARLARGDRTAAVSVALTLAGLVVAVQLAVHGSVREIAVAACVAAATLCAAGLTSERRGVVPPVTAPEVAG